MPAIEAQHFGRFIEGVQYNRFLVTVLQAMGLDPADYEVAAGQGFGEAGTGSAVKSARNGWDMSKIGEVLPDVR